MILIFAKMQNIYKIALILSLFFSVLIGLNSCKPKGAYNPYSSRKTKPSEQLKKDNDRVMKRENKNVTKLAKKSRKALFGRKTAPKQ